MNSEHQINQIVVHAIRFITDLLNLVKALEMYTEAHPVSKENVNSCLSSLQDLLEWRKEIQFFTENQNLFIDEERIPDSLMLRYHMLQKFQGFLLDRNIESLALDRNVDKSDLIKFAKAASITVASGLEGKDIVESLKVKSLTTIRVNQAPSPVSGDSLESLLLNHFLDGSLGTDLSPDIRLRLIDELTRKGGAGSRQMLEKLHREELYSYPITIRDILSSFDEKWIHLLGNIIRQVTSSEKLDQQRLESIKLIRSLLPVISGVPSYKRKSEVTELMKKIENLNDEDAVNHFWRYREDLDKKMEGMKPFLKRVSVQVNEFVEMEATETIDQEGILEELREIMPRVMNFPSLYEKLISAMNRLSKHPIMVKIQEISLDSVEEKESLKREIAASLRSNVLNFCGMDKKFCTFLSQNLIQRIIKTENESAMEFYKELLLTLIEKECQGCKELAGCELIDYCIYSIENNTLNKEKTMSIIQIWHQCAESILHEYPDLFKTKIAPLANKTLNPENFNDYPVRNYLITAWRSFSESTLFTEIFRNIIADDRKLRFKTIEELATYGIAAVYVCLGGLNNQNWHLRRNLATVIGQVVDLNMTDILREPLRDHDWHVRWEIINALARRANEVEDELKNDPNHPLMKIFFMALRDGNKSIRQTTYTPIENLNLDVSVKGLQELYQRLAAINADIDLEERVQLLKLLSKLANHSEQKRTQIINFISEVATQKEGILTPNWMIPIKKGAVEALAAIEDNKAHEWLKKLATQKPYKRGVVGREARSVCNRLKL